jgi:hypothetical protein
VVKRQGSIRARRTGLLVCTLGLTLQLGFVSRAGAHAEFVPTLVNRYISLTAFESRVDVLVSLLFGQVPAGERRRQMDLDHDGRIDPRELQRERLSWARSTDRVVRFSVDGSPVDFTAVAVVDLNGDPAVAGKPMLVTLQGSFDLAPGDRQLRVEAGPELPRLGETEIALDAAAGWTLVASLDPAGKATGNAQRLFQFPAARVASGAGPSVTFQLRSSGELNARPAWGRAAWLLLGAASAALLAMILVAVRTRR